MATDAKFDRIQMIQVHPDADALEIAIVSNFPCVVRKVDGFKQGDWVFYIRDDAKLMDYDAWKVWNKSMSEGGIGQMEAPCEFPWQENLMKYLGSGGRVKTIKLRGMTSMGILLKPDVVCPNIKDFSDEVANYYNQSIANEETGKGYLERNFGVGHWTAPQTNIGDMNTLRCGLPDGIKVSDEENWENLPESDLHLGATALVTKKLDGTSSTVVCRPDGTYSVTTRHNELRPESENVYTKFTKEAVKAGLWYAKTHNVVVAFQGEVCAHSVQTMGINKDKELDNYFVYKCYFPENENWHLKMGTYGTDSHFLKVVAECNAQGYNVKTVPVVGEVIITKEILDGYTQEPAENGEGYVLNIKVDDFNDLHTLVWDYKAKSRDYLMRIK